MVPARPSPSSGVLGRSRTAIIAGARHVVAGVGVRRTTMVAVARRAGVSKATLYNHVRDRDDLLLLLVTECCYRAIAAAEAAGPVASERLAAAAHLIATDEVIAALRSDEAAALLPMLQVGDGPVWVAVRELARELLLAAGLGGDQDSVDLVLRWLMSYLLNPADVRGRQLAARRIGLALAGSSALQVVTADRSWIADPSLTA